MASGSTARLVAEPCSQGPEGVLDSGFEILNQEFGIKNGLPWGARMRLLLCFAAGYQQGKAGSRSILYACDGPAVGSAPAPASPPESLTPASSAVPEKIYCPRKMLASCYFFLELTIEI